MTRAIGRRHALGLTAGALALPRAALARAPPWPVRPLRFVVGFAPGTATDSLARVLGEALAVAFEQPIVIDNKPGAQGSIGANLVAKAEADGQTVLIGSATTHAAAASLLKSIPYDPVKDFAPVTRLGHIGQVLVVRADFPARDVAGLLAHARANPGKLNYGTGSSGNLLPSATLAKRMGLDVGRVVYRSPPQAMADVLGGQVQFMFIDISAALAQIRAGTLRALAVSSAARSPLLPDVPSIGATLSGFELLTWFAMYAPAGTPESLLDILGNATRKAMTDPTLRGRLSTMGFEPYTSSPAELAAFTAAEVAKWRALVAETGIEPE